MRSLLLFASSAVFFAAPLASAQTPLSATASQAQAQPAPSSQSLGGPGESCRARSDCKAGLKCMNEVCTSEHEGETCGATSDCGDLKCVEHKCTSGAPGSSGSSASMDQWMKFNPLDGAVHPFAGFALAGGFGTGGFTGNFGGGFDTFNGAFLFAFQAGAFIGNHQLSFELAPVTYFYDMKDEPGPVFEMSASYAYFVPLADSGAVHFYWPIRFGLGMLAGPDTNLLGLAFFQVQADLIGVAAQVGHLVFDFHLPSFRYALTDKSGEQAHLLEWLFGTSVGYSF